MATINPARVMTFSTPSDREVAFTRTFDAPRALVWDAWTKPEHLQQWLLGPEGWTMPICEMDLRPGGAWRYGWHSPEGQGDDFEMSGVVKEVVPPARLVTTERWGPDWPEAINTLVLVEEDGRTTITLTSLYPSKEARDQAVATGMAKGVEISFERLDGVLRTLA
ncbi:MAG TPA: SRPBCC family protein [Gemmatimonadales bacterium]|nr:SRPBCC family protein [Gemmatimonadales bacterium]